MMHERESPVQSLILLYGSSICRSSGARKLGFIKINYTERIFCYFFPFLSFTKCFPNSSFHHLTAAWHPPGTELGNSTVILFKKSKWLEMPTETTGWFPSLTADTQEVQKTTWRSWNDWRFQFALVLAFSSFPLQGTRKYFEWKKII